MEQTFSYYDEPSLGKLYIQGEVKAKTQSKQSYCLNLVASSIRRQYYKDPSKKPLQALQNALKKANNILSNLENQQSNFICGVFCNGKLYLCETKNNKFKAINQSRFNKIKPEIDIKDHNLNLPIIRPQSQRKKRLFPLTTKALLTAYFIFSFFILVLAYSNQKIEQKNQEIAQQSIVKQVELKIKQAQAALVFDQENKAGQLLKQAQNLIPQIKNKIKKQSLEQEIAQYKDKEGKQKISMDNTSLKLPKTTQGLILINNKLYSFDPETNAFYTTNPLTNQHKIVLKPAEQESDIFVDQAALLKQEGNIVLLTKPAGLAIFQADKADLQFLNKITMPEKQPLAIDTYEKYAYIATENQIYKYPRALVGFSKASAWLKSPTDLKNTISMTIDGAIYVLNQNGQVNKFFRGRNAPFSLSQLPNPINNPIKIFTSQKHNFLYILEKNRVLVFNKQGQFQNQYSKDEFTNLKDFWPDEKNKTLYLLNEHEILKISLIN